VSAGAWFAVGFFCGVLVSWLVVRWAVRIVNESMFLR
jgi:hypothetical protein